MKRRLVSPDIEASSAPAGRLGISVDELSPQLADYFGTKEGVLVTTVRDNSDAARRSEGRRRHHVAERRARDDASDLRRRAQGLEGGDEFTLAIVRDKKPTTLKGKVEPPQPRRTTVKTVV